MKFDAHTRDQIAAQKKVTFLSNGEQRRGLIGVSSARIHTLDYFTNRYSIVAFSAVQYTVKMRYQGKDCALEIFLYDGTSIFAIFESYVYKR